MEEGRDGGREGGGRLKLLNLQAPAVKKIWACMHDSN